MQNNVNNKATACGGAWYIGDLGGHAQLPVLEAAGMLPVEPPVKWTVPSRV